MAKSPAQRRSHAQSTVPPASHHAILRIRIGAASCPLHDPRSKLPSDAAIAAIASATPAHTAPVHPRRTPTGLSADARDLVLCAPPRSIRRLAVPTPHTRIPHSAVTSPSEPAAPRATAVPYPHPRCSRATTARRAPLRPTPG